VLSAHDRTADLRRPDMQIDLGGIGKGFAADEAAAVLKGLGYRNALVALGGDIVVVGAPPGTAGWTIDVASLRPREPGPQVTLRDAAVSTSGDAEQWVEIAGVRYSHIIDPRTGAALTGHRSVTVIAPRATLSDGLATGVSVLGPVDGIALVRRTRGAAASISVAEGDEIRTVTSPTWPLLRRGRKRPDIHAPEFHFRALGLKRDLSAVGGAPDAFVHQVAVQPHFDPAIARVDDHPVPLADRLL
jgi:thiamine biosynthesis lipoprotein